MDIFKDTSMHDISNLNLSATWSRSLILVSDSNIFLVKASFAFFSAIFNNFKALPFVAIFIDIDFSSFFSSADFIKFKSIIFFGSE